MQGSEGPAREALSRPSLGGGSAADTQGGLPAASQLVRATARTRLGFIGPALQRPSPLGPRQLKEPRSCPPQVSIRLDGENRAVEYNSVGAVEDAVRVVFRGARVHDLFDRDWHKIALSIQAQNVSLYVDCELVQTLPIEERENIDIQGKTVIGKRLYDSVPIDVSAWPPTPACVIHQVITLGCLQREDPDSGNCHVGTQSHHLSVTHSPFHSPVHSFIHSPIHSLSHTLTHALIHSLIHSFTHPFLHSVTHSPMHALIHSLIQPPSQSLSPTS